MNLSKLDLHLTESEKNALLLIFSMMEHCIANTKMKLESKNSLTIGESDKFEDDMKRLLNHFVKTIENR